MSGQNYRPITNNDSNSILRTCITWLANPLSSTRDETFTNEFKTIVNSIGGVCAGTSSTEPMPISQSVKTDKNTPVQITLKATNPKAQYITFLNFTDPTQGIISNFDGITGNLTYTPNLDVENVTDSFLFGINVNGTNSEIKATISIGIGLVVITPTPTPTPQPGGSIGPDGVLQIFTPNTNAKAPAFYIDIDNPDKNSNLFGVFYGGDQTKFNPTKTEGNLKTVTNLGHKQTYASGAPPGKSCRFHIEADEQMGKVGKYSWKDKTIPIFLRSEKCFYSSEMTAIAKVGKALGTHQSFAFKMNSRPDKPDDTLRSTIEFIMNNDQVKEPTVKYNFAHAGYETVSSGVKVYTSEGKISVGQWIGVKMIFLISDDRKSTYMALFINTDPIDMATGQPNNAGWKIKADYLAIGIKEYNMIPPVWGGNSYLRVDGYDDVTLFRFSQVEITKDKITTAGQVLTKGILEARHKQALQTIHEEQVVEKVVNMDSANEFEDVDDSGEHIVKASESLGYEPYT